MAQGAHWPLKVTAEGAGVTGDVRVIHTQGARLRFRAPHEPPDEGATIAFVFSVPALGQTVEISCQVSQVISPAKARQATDVEVTFGELSDQAKEFIASSGKLEELALRQAQALVSGLYDPAVMLDLDWCALYYNSPYIKLSGMRPRALKRKLDSGISAFEIIGSSPERDPQVASDAVRLSRAVHLAQTNVNSIAGDEDLMGTLSYTPVLGPFGGVIAVVQTFRDESAENRMQEQYKKLLAYERMRVERMAKLVTGLAHQINTPLGIINTAGSVIESVLDVPVAYLSPDASEEQEELEELFSEIRASALLLKRNVSRVNLLVTKVKDLSSTQLTADREHADLAQVVQESVSALAPEIRKRDIKINYAWGTETPFPWDGYPDHLTRVIQELVRNTIVHGYVDAASGAVDIRISKAEGRKVYQLEIEDYGNGIPVDLQQQIFEPFVTSDRTRALGLGLAIAENIVANLLHGRIEVASEVGKNAKFTITLPQRVP